MNTYLMVEMVFKYFCILGIWAKVASALEGLLSLTQNWVNKGLMLQILLVLKYCLAQELSDTLVMEP